jgi:hypothetical protein
MEFSFRRRWRDDIEMELRAILLGGKEWIDLTEVKGQRNALFNTVMTFRLP